MDDFALPGPEWPKLKRELVTLAATCDASLAFVLDTGNILWASAGRSFARRHELADAVYETDILPRVASLRRGARLEVARDDDEAHYSLRSFASTYVLALCFEAPFAAGVIRRNVDRALPRIEEIVLKLPPAGGPGRDAGALKARA